MTDDEYKAAQRREGLTAMGYRHVHTIVFVGGRASGRSTRLKQYISTAMWMNGTAHILFDPAGKNSLIGHLAHRPKDGDTHSVEVWFQ